MEALMSTSFRYAFKKNALPEKKTLIHKIWKWILRYLYHTSLTRRFSVTFFNAFFLFFSVDS